MESNVHTSDVDCDFLLSNMQAINLFKLTVELNMPCIQLANYLLGKILVRKFEDKCLKGRIVETECYLGTEDKASQTYNGRRTPSNEPLYKPAGTAFVYMTYGMYHCFNVSAAEPGAAVLLRALEPLEGIEHMRALRSEKRMKHSKEIKDTELCSGPSKLCMAMNISKSNCNNLNVCESDELYFEHDPEFDYGEMKVVETSRIGVDRAGVEWASKPFRFYILNNSYVSKRDMKAEEMFKQ